MRLKIFLDNLDGYNDKYPQQDPRLCTAETVLLCSAGSIRSCGQDWELSWLLLISF